MMKRTIAILISILTAALLLASCSAMSSVKDSNIAMSAPGAAPSAMPRAEEQVGSSVYAYAQGMEKEALSLYDTGEVSSSFPGMSEPEDGGVSVTEPAGEGGLAEKIIYTVSADIETIFFEKTIENVYAMLALNGAFVESSYVGGMNYAQTYYGWQTFRTASFSLRVPKDRLNSVTEGLGVLGNVTSLRSDAENITAQFFDTQSRLNSYRIQEERLLDMLSKADNVPDMISIEQRLADVRYEIESLTTYLRNWQNRVDYSTLTLFIREVETFTEITPIHRSYWQQIGDGLKARTKGVGEFFTDLFKLIVINLPVLLILAVIAIVILIVVKKQIKRANKQIRRADKQIKRANKRRASKPGYPPYAQGYYNPGDPQHHQGPQGAQYPQYAQAPQSATVTQNVPAPPDDPGRQDPKDAQEP